jgi:hypothetical protein
MQASTALVMHPTTPGRPFRSIQSHCLNQEDSKTRVFESAPDKAHDASRDSDGIHSPAIGADANQVLHWDAKCCLPASDQPHRAAPRERHPASVVTALKS